MKTESNVGDLDQLPSDDKQDELKLEQASAKICCVCMVAKPFESFYQKHKTSDGTCKSCRCIERKKRYNRSVASSHTHTSSDHKTTDKVISRKPNLLTKDDIQKIAEAMLILEGWQMDLGTQQDLSNSNSISPTKKK